MSNTAAAPTAAAAAAAATAATEATSHASGAIYACRSDTASAAFSVRGGAADVAAFSTAAGKTAWKTPEEACLQLFRPYYINGSVPTGHSRAV